MNAYRKRFDAQTAFPFECVYRDTKSAQNELPDHVHDWYELVYLYSGQGTFFIDQTLYRAAAGDIFLIPGNTIHRSFPDPDDPKTATALFFSASLVHGQPLGDSFSYLLCFERAKRRKSYKLSASAREKRQLAELIDRIHEEETKKLPGCRQAVLLLLQQILLLLGRAVPPSGEEAPAPSALPGWMTGILAYIDEHPGEPLGLSELAARASVTPAHFSRAFKKLTGMNVTEYVATKRILRAKELLIASDEAVSQIAERCGFESLPHFHRTFKKLTGMTPAHYKKSE
ncbi:AraC family transcriptional regulator [Paenibacillus arenilitoris]|uniref:Helix-turn-helix transcriptional regulator n=1 Tax=Paenibacillus arenilitoris TaxID=2772299 RepID=A0A927H746_9BACL|nr:AraC family transcriptional regulator [Paenibacillus arenilitoris]MBD2869224.1 helix-turn-helix transcriptional regulator [Paenibacillus arenilitoris]